MATRSEIRKQEKNEQDKLQMKKSMVEMDDAIKNCDSYIKALRKRATEAALKEDNELVEQIIENIATVMEIQRDFSYIRNAIELEIVTADLLSSFVSLPGCLKSVSDVLKRLPKIGNISKSLNDIRGSLGKTKGELAKMRDAVKKSKSKSKDNSVIDFFKKEEKKDSDINKKVRDLIESDVAAAIAGGTSVSSAPATNTAQAPANNVAGNVGAGNGGASAGINDIFGMISDVNNGDDNK
jgi:hypothetical protein